MRERLKGAAGSVLFLVAVVALLVGACAGASSDTQQDDTGQLTYGEVMGRDVDELFNELESS